MSDVSIATTEVEVDELAKSEPKIPKEPRAEKSKKKRVPQWKATVVDAYGTKSNIKFSAGSRALARQEVSSRGLEALSLDQVRSVLTSDIGGKVPKKILLHVTRQLAAFTAAGIPVVQALTLISEHLKNKQMQSAMKSMVHDVMDGDGLAKSASLHPRVFPDYYVSMLQAAERSGDVRAAFETLAAYLERDLESTRSVRSAMYYPAVLFFLSTSAVVVLTIFVIPKFEILFASLGADLPPVTQALMNVSSFLGAWWPLILGLLIGASLFIYLIRQRESGALATDAILLRVPILGPLLTFVALERFCRILASLAESGVPLSEALLLSSSVMGNKVFEKGILDTRQGVIRGEGLSAPLGATKVFPAEAVQIFRVGEESGRLGEQLKHGADYYSGEVDYRLKNLTSLLEPAVLILVGGGVGFIAVALVSAMYGIYSAPELQ